MRQKGAPDTKPRSLARAGLRRLLPPGRYHVTLRDLHSRSGPGQARSARLALPDPKA